MIYTVTSLSNPHIYYGEYLASSRSEAKYACAQYLGLDCTKLRAVVCREAL